MEFSNLLKPEAIRIFSSVSSKKRLLHDIAGIAEACYQTDYSQTVEALMERESLGPTGVGGGIALPHARLEQLDKVVGAFVLLENPVEFDAIDKQPVDIVFGLFAPKSAGVEHLKALALVSRTLREQSIVAKLRSNPKPSTLYTILTEPANVQAA
ncbi:MAG: PTS sugar transporter subunit IIA [Paracoccaceae bacterium]|jgi:PTS system nitrogen regulatory IIA component|nr:PTS sugar transporter subunit IIA [Paracoccaceae bacterium]NCX53255.1 PTS lactose transporter subunit IIC [Rhodobacterales bacterium]NCX57909.1 PTS lactose transporter subunit IIC [Paracoccaceae bacterium]GIR86034.1 MAG: PTS lactose transporter subunit IIC [Rhodobacterales bacterium]|tara:strand:+ start:208 stop:672 length:465 start_codon:yes stop_codon:yes gene_type:complete